MDTMAYILSKGYANEKIADGKILTNEQLENIKEIPDAKKDYYGKTHNNLKERIDADIDKVRLRFDNAQLLNYSGESISANNSIEGKTKDFLIKGKTLQNLCNCSPIGESDFSSVDYSNLCNFIRNSDLIKKNTVYTFIVDYELINLTQLSQSEFLVGVDLRYKKDDNTCSSTNLGIPYLKENKSELLKVKFDTTNFVNYSGNIDKFVLVSKNCSGHIKIKNGLILEGDWTNKEVVPNYFEGIKSIEGNLSVISCGKNLCDNSKNKMIDISPTDGREWNSPTSIISDYICIRDKNVIGSFKKVNTALNLNSISYRVYDNNKNFIGTNIGLLKVGYYLRLRIITIKDSLNITTPQDVLFQLEYNTTATEFESYTEDKITLLNTFLLGNNTVQDTLSSEGILTRRWDKRPYQTGDELLNNVFTDKVTTYYQLTTPIYTNINFNNLNTYDGITNIITEGTSIQPTISAKIPSNVQAVVSSLQTENTNLNNEVSTLSKENNSLKSDVNNLNDITNTLIKSSL